MSTQVRDTLFGGQRFELQNPSAAPPLLTDVVLGAGIRRTGPPAMIEFVVVNRKLKSYLSVVDNTAIFNGNLDTDTLGGAGFASQRTTGEGRRWDLSASDAIELLIQPKQSDDKRYTFILKDEVLPPNPENGREQSTTSWEYDFRVQDAVQSQSQAGLVSIIIPWNQLKPTYRGREKDPGHAIKLTNVRRMSVMIRSFFGDQKGDFSLCLESISAVAIKTKDSVEDCQSGTRSDTDSDLDELKSQQPESKSIWAKLFGPCYRL